MDLGIKGLRVLVTAGANGIGREVARAFVEEGAKVHICDVDREAIAELARTDPTSPKHRGITLLVLPMHQPGVTVRPLRQMTGVAEFNEVFIDEARVPASWVVGGLNDGWRMATALLAHERVILTPLAGGFTDESVERATSVAIDNLLKVLVRA